MEKESPAPSINVDNASAIHKNASENTGGRGSGEGSSEAIRQTTSSDFGLQWGNRKRLRCMKFQVKDSDPVAAVHRTTVRVDRRIVRDKDSPSQAGRYLNLRRRPSFQPPPRQRILSLR